MSQENVEIIRRVVAAFNARDVEGFVRLCDSECEFLPFRAQLEGSVYRGHEGIRQFVRDMDEDWETFQVDPAEFHDRGHRVVVVGHLIATGRGTGVDIESTVGFLFELRAGRVVSCVSHSDPVAALAALGPPD